MLFELPRSSWADYDAALISAGRHFGRHTRIYRGGQSRQLLRERLVNAMRSATAASLMSAFLVAVGCVSIRFVGRLCRCTNTRITDDATLAVAPVVCADFVLSSADTSTSLI